MFGVSGGEFAVLVVVAALVLGPRNVAQAMAALRAGLDRLRQFSARMRAETSLSDVDGETLQALRGLDPSRYDPRWIVRQAVREEVQAWMDSAEAGARKPSAGRPEGDGQAEDGGRSDAARGSESYGPQDAGGRQAEGAGVSDDAEAPGDVGTFGNAGSVADEADSGTVGSG